VTEGFCERKLTSDDTAFPGQADRGRMKRVTRESRKMRAVRVWEITQ
jgi:hypothetical protein